MPTGNPAEVDGLDDFANPDLLIGLCAEEVPCGQFGREALANAGVTPSVDTNEPDVRSLLTKIEAGELDAGIVYQTDVQSAADTVEGVEIPSDVNVVATYPIAPIAAAPNPDAAQAFIDYVLSTDGPGDPRRRSASWSRDRHGRADRQTSTGPALPPAGGDRAAGHRRRRVHRAALPGAAGPDALGRPANAAPHRPGQRRPPALPGHLAERHRHRHHARCAHWPGCWPGWSSRAGRWCGDSCCCRWSCRRSSAAPPCCSPSDAAASSDSGSTTSSAILLPFSTAGVIVGRDLRRHAVPGHHRGGRPPLGRPALRGRGGHAGRGPLD